MAKRVLSQGTAKMAFYPSAPQDISKRVLKTVELLARILLSNGYVHFTDVELENGSYLTTASVYAVKVEKEG